MKNILFYIYHCYFTIFIAVLFAQQNSPNVIYILADDLGYADVGYNGQKLIETPELDFLAKNGMQFTNHYCGNAVCAPSRASLLMGKHPGHSYIRANSPGYPNGQTPIPAGSETLGTLMQRAGYTTACIGKWGLGGFHNSGNPNKQGFDYFFGYTDQRKAHNYYPQYLWENGTKKYLDNNNGKQNEYSHDLFTEKAISFIKKNENNPFFLYLAYTIPHLRLQVPDLAQYENKKWPLNMKIQAAMISRMSRDIGVIVDLIKKLGLEKNTLIMFNSDNGAHGKAGTLDFFKPSGNLKGIKRTMYEGGLRSPMVAYWPGKINAGTKNDHLSAFWDMLPTFSELTGEPIVGNSDGISMLPTLLGKNLFQKKHEYLYWELYEGRPNSAVRYGKWKGVVRDRREGNEIQLFNLEIDESEINNVAKQNPEIVLEIQSIMEKSHEKNPFWDKDFKPLFNAEAASKVNGVKADIGNKYYKPQKLNK
ncbi:MAG: arylsulfatase [Bacteroidota bacterium]|nr:arylsulfatase [Bacteroidota bacterium]MEC7549267.1 arylsulfatase [Bacteroidota bacterium]MEC8097780.1 arylsulfatase [Bacteroidota bacterium]MEC8364199.1 arylsulfatase [Bacteroidota bacterium]MEC9160424.1 arylsulfatase [Bacteroidota bacterium]|tara:strand:- start:1738 stop:3168 length:1431 start_codon:yes stop_codon:yes gene_type:complete